MADPFGRKWYYNSDTGSVALRPIADPFNHAGVGWHGPFDTEQQAVDFYVQGKANNPGWHEPTNSLWQQLKNTIDTQKQSVDKAKQQVTSSLDPFDKLTKLFDKNGKVWAIRISEVLLGLILIAVGLAKLTGTSGGDLKKVAAVVTKVVK